MAACARAWEVDAYRCGRLGERAARSFENHLRVCVECRQHMVLDERLRDRVRGWRDEPPDELAVRRLRARVCRDAAQPRRSFHGVRAAAVAAVVGLAVVSAWAVLGRREVRQDASAGTPAVTAESPAASIAASELPPTAPESLAGAVLSSQGGRWSQSREDQVESLRLDDGTIRVHVRPQRPGERFLVALPDGELEVRGTTFEVGVQEAATQRVRVEEGVVELRLKGRAPLRLGARDEWNARRAAVGGSVVVAPAPHPPPAPIAPSGTVAASDDHEAAYAVAVRLLSEGHHEEAASAFRAFVRADPRGDLAQDASFLEAVALARAGRADAAALVAEGHLASYPGSFHRKDAALLVARAAVTRGDCAGARAVLAPWAADPDVRGAIAACDAKDGVRSARDQ